ncbi:MAG: plasmid pRiA4b ORF-3 family protein [Candidatus Aminicenantales bacterium]
MVERIKPRASRRREVKMYQLIITLGYINPPIWRRLLVRSDANLAMLHSIIQVCMGWTNSHLHQFTIGKRVYSDPDFEIGEDFGGPPVLDEGKSILMEIAPREKAKIIYEYDFGDSWRHLILVEKILDKQDSEDIVAECIDGSRACPPEDCGGIGGYANLLEIIKNPRHEEYESMMDWLGGKFDPEAFDREKINKYLRKLKQPLLSEMQLAKILMKRDGYKE